MYYLFTYWIVITFLQLSIDAGLNSEYL